jgi:hypothetical protein
MDAFHRVQLRYERTEEAPNLEKANQGQNRLLVEIRDRDTTSAGRGLESNGPETVEGIKNGLSFRY